MRMHAGKLRDRVTVERATETPDGAGGAVVTWSGQGTLAAHIEPVRAAERVEAAQQRGVVMYRVTVRNSGVGAAATTTDRLVWLRPSGDVVLNIRGAPVLPSSEPWRVLESEAGVQT